MVFFLLSTLLIFNTDKFSLHQHFNQWVGNFYCNLFFKWITFLGDGLFIVIFSIAIMFFNFRLGTFIIISYCLSGLTTQFLKLNVFDDINRPFYFYSYYNFKIKIVEGVNMHIHNSFPSGHSTAAWSLFFGLSLWVKNNPFKFVLILLGIFTSFSRVYLSQHFFEDIITGAIIGSVFSFFIYYFLYHSKFSLKWKNGEQSLLKYFKKNG